MTDLFLAGRMEIVRISNVDGHRESCIAYRLCRQQLSFAQPCPDRITEFRTLTMIWQLHDKKRKIAFFPAVAPACNQRWQKRSILIGSPSIPFSLIPNYAANPIWLKRRNHSLIQASGRPHGIANGRHIDDRKACKRIE